MISDLKTGCATGLTRFALLKLALDQIRENPSKALVTTCDPSVIFLSPRGFCS
jgi:hypothetical protein